MTDFRPVHPGEVLAEDFLKPLGMNQQALAKALGVPQARISDIVDGKRPISPEIARALSRHFGTTAEYWLDMQASYDLELARDASGKSGFADFLLSMPHELEIERDQSPMRELAP